MMCAYHEIGMQSICAILLSTTHLVKYFGRFMIGSVMSLPSIVIY